MSSSSGVAARLLQTFQTGNADSIWCLQFLTEETIIIGFITGSLQVLKIEKSSAAPEGSNANNNINNNNLDFGIKTLGEQKAKDLNVAITSIVPSFSNNRICFSTMSGLIQVIRALNDTEPPKTIKPLPLDCWKICRVKDNMVASGSHTGSVNIWDVDTLQLVKTLEVESTATSTTKRSSFALSIDSYNAGGVHLIVVGYKDGSVRLFDLEKEIAENVTVHSLPVRCVRFSKDGKYVYTASDDTTCAKLDAVDLSVVCTYKGNQAMVMDIAISSKYLATASSDRKVKLYDVETREIINKFEVHQGQALCVRFSPNEEFLVSAGGGGDVCLFKVI